MSWEPCKPGYRFPRWSFGVHSRLFIFVSDLIAGLDIFAHRDWINSVHPGTPDSVRRHLPTAPIAGRGTLRGEEPP